MSYTDSLFDVVDPLFDDSIGLQLDTTPVRSAPFVSRLRQVSSMAALPSYDLHAAFNAQNNLAGARARQPSAYLTSPMAAKTGLSMFGTPQQDIRVVDDFAVPHYGSSHYAEEDGLFDQADSGLGMAFRPPSTKPAVNFANMRVYGVPVDKTTGKPAAKGQFTSYANHLGNTSAALRARKENAPPTQSLRDFQHQAPSPAAFAPSPPPTPSNQHRRNKKSMSIRTDEPVETPRSPKRVKSMPSMREPKTPPPKHAAMPLGQPKVPFNSPTNYATPLRQQQQMPFSFSDLFDTGLGQGSDLDVGGFGGPRSPTSYSSYTMESTLSSTSDGFDYDFGLSSDGASLLPTPLLQSSSVLSTPSSTGCRSPDSGFSNPVDALINPVLNFNVSQTLGSPTGSTHSGYDDYLGDETFSAHMTVPSMHEEMGWAMPSPSSVAMSRDYQSIDSVLSSASGLSSLSSQSSQRQPAQPVRRTQRTVSRKRSRADFLADQSEEEDEDYGGSPSPDDEYVLSSEDIEVGESQDSEDGDYNPSGYASPPPARRQFSAQAPQVQTTLFDYANPRPKPSRVFSAPSGRLRPGPKPKRSIPNMTILTTVSTGPDLQTVREALARVGADPDLVYRTDVPDDDDDDVEYSGTLPRAVIRALYQPGGSGSQKRYKCLITGCDRHFPRKSAIESHIQTHLEDKPFICEIEDCGAAFVRQHDLRRHQRIHSDTKQYNCACGKGFARGDALTRHRQRGICVGSSVPRRDR